MPKKQKITKNMKLGEVVNSYPGTIEVFMKHGLPCAGCHVAGFETVEQGAKAHGMNKKKIDKLLEELNKVAKW